MRRLFACISAGCALAAAFISVAAPAAAEPGIVVLREVGPRNALHPTNGAALTVNTAPDAFGGAGVMQTLSDADAAGISAGKIAGASVSSFVSPILAQDFGPGASGVAREAAERGGVGGTVRGALDTGLGAMRGALSSVRGVCC